MGIYVGVFIYLYYYGNQIDELIVKNNQLEAELKVCQDEKLILEKENKKRSYQLIRSVKFNFTDELDSFDETELLKILVDETHFLIGKKVDDVGKSPEFIYHLLNGKKFNVEDKYFEIRVKIIYIQTNTEIWISAKEQKM